QRQVDLADRWPRSERCWWQDRTRWNARQHEGRCLHDADVLLIEQREQAAVPDEARRPGEFVPIAIEHEVEVVTGGRHGITPIQKCFQLFDLGLRGELVLSTQPDAQLFDLLAGPREVVACDRV